MAYFIIGGITLIIFWPRIAPPTVGVANVAREAVSMNSLIDQVLNQRYRLCEKLSQKPGSQTFLATDLSNDTSVVVKLLLFDAEFTWESLRLFEREAAALKALNHPAIPAYLDFADVTIGDRKGFLLAQTYIEAPSLQDWLQQGRSFSEAELQQIAKTTLDILAYLHSRQPSVIHRDIKPSNVLLTDRSGHQPGQIYLVDFGAIQGPQQTGTITIVGTYGYMPLEQFGGRAVPASDLYSLGATLVYLATGQHPADLPQQDMRLQFADRVQLSAAFAHWLQWLLEPDVGQRPQTVAIALEYFDSPPNPLAGVQTNSHKIQRPKSSSITLDRAPNSLLIQLPSQKLTKQTYVGSIRNSVSFILNIILWLGIAVAFPIIMIVLPLGLILILRKIFLLLIQFLLALLMNLNRNLFFGRSHIKFEFDQSKDKIIVELFLRRPNGQRPLWRQQLLGISTGPYSRSRHCVHFVFGRSFPYTLRIQGGHQETQWLCDELTRWTGWSIGYQDFTKSA